MEERRAKARELFKDHQATVILQNDQFLIVDWRNRNGSSNYAARYILDIEEGNFIVSGDLGDSIASWHNRVMPENMSNYLNDINYYIGKLQCTSDKYTYNWSDIEEDLEDIKQQMLKDGYDLDEVNEDFGKMKDILDEIGIDEHSFYPDELTDLFEKYWEPWFESPFCDLGERISQRVYLCGDEKVVLVRNYYGRKDYVLRRSIDAITCSKCKSLYEQN